MGELIGRFGDIYGTYGQITDKRDSKLKIRPAFGSRLPDIPLK